MCVFSQMAVTSRLTLVYNQKRLMRALEVDKQSSLAEMVKSESAGDAGQDHHGENLSFAVFNSQSKVVLDMHREELVHVESSASTPEMLLKMPLASISGVVDKQGSARVIKFSDETSLSVEIQAVDRIQLTKVSVPINNNIIIVNALQSFEDINQQTLMDQESSVWGLGFRVLGLGLMEQESSVYLNRKDMQSEILRFRTLQSSATMGLGFRV